MAYIKLYLICIFITSLTPFPSSPDYSHPCASYSRYTDFLTVPWTGQVSCPIRGSSFSLELSWSIHKNGKLAHLLLGIIWMSPFWWGCLLLFCKNCKPLYFLFPFVIYFSLVTTNNYTHLIFFWFIIFLLLLMYL